MRRSRTPKTTPTVSPELLAEYQKAQATVAEVPEKLRQELEDALTR